MYPILNNTRQDALDLLEYLTNQFPGLLDGNTEVNGADLTEFLSNALREGLIGEYFKK